jgi:hypothetical protein
MLEDRQGFEPWGRITTPNFLAGSPDKPLWHLSVLFVSALMRYDAVLPIARPKGF